MQRSKNPTGMGPGGSCICTDCGYSEPHQRGVPCLNRKCPHCGKPLVREGYEQ